MTLIRVDINIFMWCVFMRKIRINIVRVITIWNVGVRNIYIIHFICMGFVIMRRMST